MNKRQRKKAKLNQANEFKDFRHGKSNILETSGGEIPDPSSKYSDKKVENAKAAFATRVIPGRDSGLQGIKKEERSPESHGDLADCAEEEIEDDIQNELDRIHLKVAENKNDNHQLKSLTK